MKNKKEFITIEEINQYKKFAFREDITKMSIAFILGASINKVVSSIGNNLLGPIINFIIMKPSSIWSNISIKLDENTKIDLGVFFNALFEFLITSIVLYVIYIKLLGRLIKVKENTKRCEYCMSEINKYANKCPHCTSNL